MISQHTVSVSNWAGIYMISLFSLIGPRAMWYFFSEKVCLSADKSDIFSEQYILIRLKMDTWKQRLLERESDSDYLKRSG